MTFDDVLKDIREIYKASSVTKTKINRHEYIKHKICELATKYNCIGKEEYYNVGHYIQANGRRRKGRMDVVWFYKDVMILAVEIDSVYRYKSVKKLLNVDAKYKVWLCYDPKKVQHIHKKIYYILPYHEV